MRQHHRTLQRLRRPRRSSLRRPMQRRAKQSSTPVRQTWWSTTWTRKLQQCATFPTNLLTQELAYQSHSPYGSVYCCSAGSIREWLLKSWALYDCCCLLSTNSPIKFMIVYALSSKRLIWPLADAQARVEDAGHEIGPTEVEEPAAQAAPGQTPSGRPASSSGIVGRIGHVIQSILHPAAGNHGRTTDTGMALPCATTCCWCSISVCRTAQFYVG